MHSIWEEEQLSRHEALSKDIHTDVLIIGGGMAGILCAHKLHQAGVDYVLVEKDELAKGVTGCTTAKITAQHGLIYSKLIRRYGTLTAKGYLEANERAIQAYSNLCRQIDCDFEYTDNYVYSRNNKRKLTKEFLTLRTLGYPAEYVNPVSLPFPNVGAIRFPNQAQFHPLKFLSAISGPLHIYEHTAVREFVGMTAVTDCGTIYAKRIIVATHFPFLNKHGLYPLKLYQDRSYIIALEHAENVKGMYVDEAHTGLSFRNYKNLLLIGGGSHRTGKPGGSWDALRDIARKYYPNAVEKYRWATQDCMSLDGIPYIGQYSENTEGLYVAAGFNKWGMTSSMVASEILCDLVQGRENPYASIFSPARSILHPQLAVNGWKAAVSLLTPTARRCPHMGCALKWNDTEHTWDCPCHGSRFTQDGKLIDNPATGDLPKK